MATVTVNITYTRAAQLATGTFLYTASVAGQAYSPGWGSESLSATGATKEDARDNLIKLVELAIRTNGLGEQVVVTT